jgi:TonB-linked SusC/RagA family outer membrane protein
MMKSYSHFLKLLVFIAAFLLSAFAANAQHTVQGKITDENGDPLIGVNVVEKGTMTGTVTNVDGNYEITVSGPNATLNMSFVGYLQEEVAVDGRSVIDVTLLPDIKSINEVVVVGYGTQKKADVTGAVATVTSEEIEKSTAGRINEAIQGKLAGVTVTQNSGSPGGSVSIRIRGLGSINNNDPLIVIDGFPTKDGLENLNPDDISSINVLKDASATAIYGARGANGVIMITTKSGESGESKISFNASYGVQDLGSDFQMLNSVQYANLYNEILMNNGQEPYFIKTDEAGNVIPIEEWMPKDSADLKWLDIVTREPQAANIQKYTLSATGGGDMMSYMSSVGYFNQKGIIKGSEYQRLNLRLNVDGTVNSWINVGARLNYANSLRNNSLEQAVGKTVVGRALRQMPFFEPYREDGTFNVANNNPGGTRNALRTAIQNDDISRAHDFIGSIFTEVTFFEGLKYKINAGGSVNNYLYEWYQPVYGRLGDKFSNPEADASRSGATSLNWLIENTLTYSATFGQSHNLVALLGYTAQEDRVERYSASVEGFPHPSVRQLSSASEMKEIDGEVQEWALLSQLARINYDYVNKYLLTASIRRDGSSRFGAANKWGYFPSFSLGWKISEEPFMQRLSAISSLKLRAGWGQTGNQEIGNYRHYAKLGFVNYVSGDNLLMNQGVAPLEYPNTSIQWETTKMTNIGMDLALWRNQLTFVLEYYHRGTNGMLLQKPLPGSAGYRVDPVRNIGEIVNDGIEVIITHKNSIGEFNYTVSVNGAYNRNEVESLGGSTPISGASMSDVQRGFLTRTEEGYPIGGFYGWVMDGIFQDWSEVKTSAFQTSETAPGDVKFRDLNGDNRINGQDRTYIGSPWPDFTYGLTTDFNYKSWSLSLFFQGVQGNEIYFMDRTFYEDLSSGTNQSIRVLEDHYWTPENPSNTMPRAIAGNPNDNNRFSTRFVEDGSYIRLKNLVFSYRLPQSMRQKLNIENAQVFLKASNLFTITDFTGLDPEVGEFNNSTLRAGISMGQYPVSRIFSIGLNLSL